MPDNLANFGVRGIVDRAFEWREEAVDDQAGTTGRAFRVLELVFELVDLCLNSFRRGSKIVVSRSHAYVWR